MVIKTEICRFSGLKIYPGHGTKYFRTDTQSFLFLKRKCRTLFNQRKKPSKIAWTFSYRKAHKKDQSSLQTKRKRRTVKANPATRNIGAVSLEVIQKKRSEKPEVRQAARDAAMREVKERAKKAKELKAKAKAGASKGGKKGRR